MELFLAWFILIATGLVTLTALICWLTGAENFWAVMWGIILTGFMMYGIWTILLAIDWAIGVINVY